MGIAIASDFAFLPDESWTPERVELFTFPVPQSGLIRICTMFGGIKIFMDHSAIQLIPPETIHSSTMHAFRRQLTRRK